MQVFYLQNTGIIGLGLNNGLKYYGLDLEILVLFT